MSIPKPISTPDVITNQVGSSSIGSNNTNAGKSGWENAVVVDSVVENKRIEESNKDAKIHLEV